MGLPERRFRAYSEELSFVRALDRQDRIEAVEFGRLGTIEKGRGQSARGKVISDISKAIDSRDPESRWKANREGLRAQYSRTDPKTGKKVSKVGSFG